MVFVFLAFITTLFYIAYGAADYITGNGIDDSVIYHLVTGLNQAGIHDYFHVLIASIGLVALSILLLVKYYFSSVRMDRSRRKFETIAYLLLCISLATNPTTIGLVNNHSDWLVTKNSSTASAANQFEDLYRIPQIKEISKTHNNLVVIYAESLERSYFDDKKFPGLVNGVRALESAGTSFTNIKQLAGTGWTIAGFVASQCGIPIFTSSFSNALSGLDQFMPGIICLGDMLAEQGYELEYFGGARIDFAGKDKFLKQHGFSQVHGRKELLPSTPNPKYRTIWGLYDDTLFDIVYKRFVEKSQAGEKFGLVTLTLDTHHSKKDLISEACKNRVYGDGSNPRLNSVHCSDHLITELINKIVNSPYGGETTIVLVSDHLAMKADSLLSGKSERTNLFLVLDPDEKKTRVVDSLGSTFDIGATLLPFLGYSAEIGLGRNLLSSSRKVINEIVAIHAELTKWRKDINKIWNYPKINEFLKIDTTLNTVTIDNRVFAMPILIGLDTSLNSELIFLHEKRYNTLSEHINRLGDVEKYILVDECKNAQEIIGFDLGEGYCLVFSGQEKVFNQFTVDGEVKFSVSELDALFEENEFVVKRVAHAGGGLNDQKYTNSIQALDNSINNGFQYFEIDFVHTSDGKVVCLHDWEKNFKKIFGYEVEKRLTFAEFEVLVKNHPSRTNCTLDSLGEWMIKNPSAIIVTDVKDNNLDALEVMVKTLPDAQIRVIPQIYKPKNYDAVKKLGFNQVIWTLYKYKGDNRKVLEWATKFIGPVAITMPKKRARSDLPQMLRSVDILSYAHTINSLEVAEELSSKFGITEIYTDFLPPGK